MRAEAISASSTSSRNRDARTSSIRGPQATILTACAVGIGIGLGGLFGPLAVLLYGLTIPVPLVLLWLSADVHRSDER